MVFTVQVLGMMSTDGNPGPSNRLKLIWGFLITGISTSLLLAAA